MASSDVLSASPPACGGLRHGVMATVALGFLAVLGVILPHGDTGESFREALRMHPWYGVTLVGLWGVIGMEALVGLRMATDGWRARWRRFFLILLLPPLRMTTATSTRDGWLWLPGHGWRPAGPVTTLKLEHKLALPMLVLTLLVLPVLGVEFGAGGALETRPRLALAVHLTTSLIWIGFTAEFLWMISATPQKLDYCVRNWVNLVIILLPLVAFLRVLTMLRFLRAGQLLRAYRLRTLQSRVWRLLLVFNLFERLQQRNPEKYRAGLEKRIGEMEEELVRLREKLERCPGERREDRLTTDGH
ncbi:potassium channel protein - like protein [Brevifollis gellanilyticus]|nr:potassium channel protein - like protein [Brevifollis gellanilyticus]